MQRLPLYDQDRVMLVSLLQFAQEQLLQLVALHRLAPGSVDLFTRHASRCADLITRLTHAHYAQHVRVKDARPPP